MTHGNWIEMEKRPLTEQERSWVSAILSVSKEWADVNVDPLFATGRCPCGKCRSIRLEAPTRPQNPLSKLRLIGEIDIQTDEGDLLTIMLHARNGSLSELEVINDHSFKAVPERWKEVSRWVTVQ